MSSGDDILQASDALYHIDYYSACILMCAAQENSPCSGKYSFLTNLEVVEEINICLFIKCCCLVQI